MVPTMTAMRCPTLAELPPPPPGRVGWPWTEECQRLPATMPGGGAWPTISIVTPSYNQAAFLEETIRSVLLQGYPSLEYVVMDGGSTDGSAELIRKYEPWLSFVHIGPDGGQSAAIREGFRHTTGEIQAWINSDDRFLAGAFGRVGQFFAERPSVVFGSGDVNVIDGAGRLIHRVYAVRPNRTLTANLGLHVWPQQGCFWRRSAYLRAGEVDPSWRFCMDRDLFLRLVAVGASRRIPGAPLGEFRIHADTKTSTMQDVARAESAKLIRHYGWQWLSARTGLLRVLWNLWCKPAGLRTRLHNAFGWEL
jgi:glycosyltransferase involved in cell wall biosynthesis